MPEGRRTERVEEILRQLQGRRGVYREKHFIRLVRMKTVDLDDWGVRFQLEIVPAQGFPSDGQTEFEASAKWEFLKCSDQGASAAWSSWSLIFGAGLVEELVSFAPGARSIEDLIDRFDSRPRGF